MQGLTALVMAAGTIDVWLCKRPALWADETAAELVQYVGINGPLLDLCLNVLKHSRVDLQLCCTAASY